MKVHARFPWLALCAVLASCQQPHEPSTREPAAAPLPALSETEARDWAPLFGTACVFREVEKEAKAPCPPAYAKGRERSIAYTTDALVCCSTPLDEAASPMETEPPWAPERCAGTGIAECDAYMATLYDFWERGTPQDRAGARYTLDDGCVLYRHAIKTNGLDETRTSCVYALAIHNDFLRRRAEGRIGPTPALPSSVRPRIAQMALDRAVEHQRTPQTCSNTTPLCDAYTRAFYDCWKRATPEVRAHLEPHIAVNCKTFGEMDASDLCETALDVVLANPACKPYAPAAHSPAEPGHPRPALRATPPP